MTKHEYGKLRDEALIAHLQSVHDELGGNKVAIAERLGVSERNLRNLISDGKVIKPPVSLKMGTELWRVEKNLMEQVYISCEHNKEATARKLGMSPKAVYYKLLQHRDYDFAMALTEP